MPGNEDEKIAATCVRWRPCSQTDSEKNSNNSRQVLVTAMTNGLIEHWNVGSKDASPWDEIINHQDTVNVMDYTCDGQKLLVAGGDRHVHVYGEQTCQLISSMHSDGLKVPGHKNRIFSLRCHPKDANICVTGGWDGMMKIYDLR